MKAPQISSRGSSTKKHLQIILANMLSKNEYVWNRKISTNFKISSDFFKKVCDDFSYFAWLLGFCFGQGFNILRPCSFILTDVLYWVEQMRFKRSEKQVDICKRSNITCFSFNNLMTHKSFSLCSQKFLSLLTKFSRFTHIFSLC